jgi:hypothetical protein
VKCNKHQLSIDAATRTDVRRYVRDRLNEIGAKYLGAAAGTWPALHHFDRLVEIADGLFALATAMVNYIGDATFANPVKRLRDLLAFIERADDLAVDNPLKTLDLLYSRILAHVPPSEWPVTKLLLYVAFRHSQGLKDTQGLANFLRLEQNEFYAAVRYLHAVIDVPSAEDAAKRLPQMYHTSFLDYLANSHRSGSFSFGNKEDMERRTLILFWRQSIWNAHVSDGECTITLTSRAFFTKSLDLWKWEKDLKPSILSHLSWTSADHAERLALQLNAHALHYFSVWTYLTQFPLEVPQSFYPLMEAFDFRYMPIRHAHNFLNALNLFFAWQQVSAGRAAFLYFVMGQLSLTLASLRIGQMSSSTPLTDTASERTSTSSGGKRYPRW